MSTFEGPFQKAVYTALAGNVNVGGQVPVYDHVPPDDQAVYPRIVLGSFDAVDLSDKSRFGQELFLTVDVWSRQRGKKQAQDIMSAIHTLLQDQDLTLDAGDLVVLVLTEPTRIILDPDGLTYHGVQTWRATVHAT